MATVTTAGGSLTIGRLLARCLAISLTSAALVACAALLSGSWDDTDWRVIGTSAAFSVFSGLAAAGATARARGWRGGAVVGGATIAFAGAAFGLVTVGLWTDDLDMPQLAWRICWLSALAAVVLAHACVVTTSRRPTDRPLIRGLATASIVLAALDSVGPALAIVGVVDGVGEVESRVFAVLLVLLLLTTALPSILNRAAGGREPASPPAHTEAAAAFGAPRGGGAADRLAAEVLASVERLEQLDLGREAQRELAHLRATASAAV